MRASVPRATRAPWPEARGIDRARCRQRLPECIGFYRAERKEARVVGRVREQIRLVPDPAWMMRALIDVKRLVHGDGRNIRGRTVRLRAIEKERRGRNSTTVGTRVCGCQPPADTAAGDAHCLVVIRTPHSAGNPTIRGKSPWRRFC